MKQQTKKIYKAREGSPFKQEDAQEIGEFIENCKDKSTRGILEKVKKNPKSKIYSLFEWNVKKRAELYLLQRVREIITHIEIEIISLGDSEPISLNIALSAFKSVKPINSDERVYIPIEEGMNNEVYRKQIIQRAETELKNWMEKYNQYKELQIIINALQKVLK